MSAPAKLVGGTSVMPQATTISTGWVLTYRKSGRTRHFASLEAARKFQVRAAARYGTRWLSLRPETPSSD